MAKKVSKKIVYVSSMAPNRLVNGQNIKVDTLAAERKKTQTKHARFHKSRTLGMALVKENDLEPVSQELVLEINSLTNDKPSIIGKIKRKLIGKHIYSSALGKKGK